MATYVYFDTARGGRYSDDEVRGFWWSEEFQVKARIEEAPREWLLERSAELADANPGWNIAPRLNCRTGQMINPEWDPADAIGKYIWLKSRVRPVAEAPGGVKGFETAHFIEAPTDTVFTLVGLAGLGACSGFWIEFIDNA